MSEGGKSDFLFYPLELRMRYIGTVKRRFSLHDPETLFTFYSCYLINSALKAIRFPLPQFLGEVGKEPAKAKMLARIVHLVDCVTS